MTREQAKKWMAEISAFARGSDILLYNTDLEEWTVNHTPQWRIDRLYIINDKHVEVREAYAMGEDIEYLDDGRWTYIREPNWIDSTEYRVKPKWIPKQGEIIQVSIGKALWEQLEFICMTKTGDNYICFNADGSYASVWYYAKELLDE